MSRFEEFKGGDYGMKILFGFGVAATMALFGLIVGMTMWLGVWILVKTVWIELSVKAENCPEAFVSEWREAGSKVHTGFSLVTPTPEEMSTPDYFFRDGWLYVQRYGYGVGVNVIPDTSEKTRDALDAELTLIYESGWSNDDHIIK